MQVAFYVNQMDIYLQMYINIKETDKWKYTLQFL